MIIINDFKENLSDSSANSDDSEASEGEKVTKASIIQSIIDKIADNIFENMCSPEKTHNFVEDEKSPN